MLLEMLSNLIFRSFSSAPVERFRVYEGDLRYWEGVGVLTTHTYFLFSRITGSRNVDWTKQTLGALE